ncbi:Ig-like domain-containing protein [Streptomyces sp. NPDC058373]|uniref:L,D-transpeptidase n=1 Tax=Streptomyces sp. NPDC058373 TaxID=3346465 RepID=UPI003651CE39
MRRAVAGAAAVLALVAALAGCGAGSGPGLGDDGAGGGPGRPVLITITPSDGSVEVGPGQELEVRVDRGRLESVKVVRTQDARDEPVPGELSGDGRRWRPVDGSLALAAKYTVDAVASDGERRAARHATFTTLVPQERFIGYVTPENRATVGTGMIVSLEFNREISDRAAVERAVRVTADPEVPVAAHWFGRDRLDFRPEEYWEPGTEVTVDLRLRDVEGAPGVFGLQRKAFTFTVGRSQVSTVDAAAHTLRVVRAGEEPVTVPVTAGAPGTTTYNGKMVVTEMLEITRMDGSTVGFGGEYDIPDVPHAMRLTRSGTFLHGNYWAGASVFGSSNVSHGCVGLRDVRGGGPSTPAGWFFDRSLIGDVVEVVNSDDRTVAPDNGLGGWNLDWREWRAGSALG